MYIRTATGRDARAIATVHVVTWQSAYRGIVPEDYLSSLSVENSQTMWEAQLAAAGSSAALIFVAESSEQGVLGFACGGPNRGQESEFDAELYAIYVSPTQQRHGVGRALVKAVALALMGQGRRGLIVWVLSANPARRFYESLGGTFIGERPVMIGAASYPEAGYGWDDLRTLIAALTTSTSRGWFWPGSAVGRRAAVKHIQLAELFNPGEDYKLKVACQIGIQHAIAGVLPELSRVPRERYVETLERIQAGFQAKGLTIAGVESHPVPAEKIKLGLPGRDEEIENYVAAIKALSEVGIPMVCYNFMAGLGWYRTKVDVPERGGALVSEFNNQDANTQGLTEWREVSEDQIWSNIEYFLKAVIPVAEKAKVQMALHPDDPPISPLRGIGRILTSAKNYRRVLGIVPSPVNGITFCQANFKLMGEDIAALAREWCSQKKIFFVHFRDVEGTREHFRETFHDNGPTDMARMLQVYKECGFQGPMRPDHAPTLEGESNDRPGYAMAGKILAIGYMKGAMDSLHIPYE